MPNPKNILEKYLRKCKKEETGKNGILQKRNKIVFNISSCVNQKILFKVIQCPPSSIYPYDKKLIGPGEESLEKVGGW